MTWLRGKKTYIIAALMALIGVIKMVAGEMSIPEFFMSPDMMVILNGLGLGALRAGVKKVPEP
ncbi:MAG: hypothetical protein ACE5E9_12620 [Nitrospinaceae bacterium]